MENKTIFGMFRLEPDYVIDYQFCPAHYWVQMKIKCAHHPDFELSFECDDYKAFMYRDVEIDASLREDALQLLDFYEMTASTKKEDRPRVNIISTKINT